MTVNIAVAGPGAFGVKHLEALANIEDARVTWLIGRDLDRTAAVAEQHGVEHATTALEDVLDRDEVDAVILCTPTQMHAAQAIQCLDAGKHVEVEIPLCDVLADGERVVARAAETGLATMVGHTRRFNPSHLWIKRRIDAGDYDIQQLNVETYFFRRSNLNALGAPRSWTDHLLWHHAAHTVDLFQHQTGAAVIAANVLEGPIHPELGIAMDMSIQLKAATGAICTLSLSFNNDGPLGTFFRYIGDNGTYIARYDELVDGYQQPVDLTGTAPSSNGIENQDREFVDAIVNAREPQSSAAQVLPCYQILAQLEQQLA